MRHETKNLQLIRAEGFFEPDRINLQQKDDYPTQRVATLEEENRQLRERAAAAEAAGRAAQAEAASLQATLAAARAALADKEAGLVAALTAATAELTRMGERQAAAERRRALETDNVRQAYRAERDALAGRVVFLEEELKTARIAAEAYRKARGG